MRMGFVSYVKPGQWALSSTNVIIINNNAYKEKKQCAYQIESIVNTLAVPGQRFLGPSIL